MRVVGHLPIYNTSRFGDGILKELLLYYYHGLLRTQDPETVCAILHDGNLNNRLRLYPMPTIGKLFH